MSPADHIIKRKFLANVNKQRNGCWLWSGRLRKNGFGRFETGNRRLGTRKSHCAKQSSFYLYRQESTQGMLIFTRCNRVECVNPDHLYLVPRKYGEKKKLTYSELKELVDYDPITGAMTWASRAHAKAAIGEQLGTLSGGYLICGIKNIMYRVHILAWLYMTKEYPLRDIDHINHIQDDNTWGNLRLVTKGENSRNMEMRKTNTSGYTGVSWKPDRNKWRARIRVNKKETHLGYFESKTDAKKAWDEAVKEYGFHGNHGKKLR